MMEGSTTCEGVDSQLKEAKEKLKECVDNAKHVNEVQKVGGVKESM